MSKKIFGIDLGTTNSAIALYENGIAKILKNTEGYEVTPSVIFFTGVDALGKDESIVGIEAKNHAATDPDNVVQFVKRNMGKLGSVYNHRAPSGTEYTPEMSSALILKKVCQGAEQFVGEGNVKDVVITVPAYFDDARRTATKQAGKIAGLNVLRVINEPTAAAIAYGVDTEKNGKVLVYDLGGGTFDVTVMQIDNGLFDVIATGGDSQLGGVNFDQKILSIFVRKLNEQGCDINDEDDALMAELREKAEKTKISLSNIENARQILTINGKNYRIEITREEFEIETQSLIYRTEILLNEVLSSKNVNWEEIDEVLLVGGSTRMPMVKKMMERVSGKNIVYKVDPDTAVAIGAAILANTMSVEDEPEDIRESTAIEPYNGNCGIFVSDVTSQSLGVITVDKYNHSIKKNTIIIPHNTKIPTKQSRILHTLYDNQTKLDISVTEGDDEDVEYVKVIGNSLLDIPPYPKESPIEVIYAYDIDQTIYIEVIDMVSGKSLGTFEINRTSNLTDSDVDQAIEIIGKMYID